jgi:polysaccharide deacetylase 2 family uncharacterized protein YibQ
VAGLGQRRGGLIAAYLLVLGLITASAAFVFGVEGETPRIADRAAAAAVAAAPVTTGSLALPPKATPPQPLAPEPAPPEPPPLKPALFRGFAPAELRGLIEVTEEGQRLPRVSPSGWMPWIAYARRFDPAGPPARVGVLMINLGASEKLMRRAIDELPGEVSLAFLAATPDLPRWLREAREHGHEAYLMLPIEDPNGPAERGLRPLQASAEPAENLRRLRAAMARGAGYVGFVIASAGAVSQSESAVRPLLKEIADRGLAVIEISPTPATAAVHRLTVELGTGYARTADVLDYKLADGGVAGNLDRLVAWAGESAPEQPPRHGFGVMQPDDEAIDALLAWFRRRPERPAASFVPIIGHFECRDACMVRMRAQPAQLRP